MLLLKLFLVPGLVALITLAGRRWGPAMAGWLSGFPVVAGPTLLFIALDQGAAFAAQSAHVTLMAVLGNVAFGVTYAWMALRYRWFVCAAAGVLAFVLVGWVLVILHPSPWVALAMALIGLPLAAHGLPKVAFVNPGRAVSRWELPVRCAAAGALVTTVTLSAAELGPVGSGMLTIFPVMGMVLGVFSHIAWGGQGAIHLLTGLVKGLYAFVAFCFVLALALPPLGTAAAFGLALVVALVVQALTFKRTARRLLRVPEH
ncbi:MAG: hypothetical protein V4794_04615 [Pseudomonadota bacterium]